jgi:hypothetical protein
MSIFKWFIVIVVLLMGFFIFRETRSIVTPSIYKELPRELAYKYMGHNMVGDTLYVVYDQSNYRYYINREQFITLNVPQLIGEGLYLMPDGAYLCR